MTEHFEMERPPEHHLDITGKEELIILSNNQIWAFASQTQKDKQDKQTDGDCVCTDAEDMLACMVAHPDF